MIIAMEDKNQYLHLLITAQEISDNGPKAVDDLRVTEQKRLYSLIVEAFRSFSAFSRLIRMHFLVQSCAVLRLFIEEVSKIVILEQHPELYDTFVRHCQVREMVLDMSQKDRKKTVLREFGLRENQFSNALSYLDYGWIKSLNDRGQYGYHEMLKLACVENSTILAYIDNLDQFIHQNIDSHSLTHEGFEAFELDNMYLAFIGFEKLLVSFHNLNTERRLCFAINGKRVLEDIYWPEYEKIIKPEDKLE